MISLVYKVSIPIFLDDVRLFSKIAQYADSILRIFSALVSAGDNCIFRDNVIKSILIFYQNGLIFDIEKVVLVLDFRTVSQTILFWRKPLVLTLFLANMLMKEQYQFSLLLWDSFE
jgi:hypothetical protein